MVSFAGHGSKPCEPQCLSDQATSALRHCSKLRFCQVECDVREGMAILRGAVASYYLKQLAQEVVRKLDGIDHVVNRLVVDSSVGMQPG